MCSMPPACPPIHARPLARSAQGLYVNGAGLRSGIQGGYQLVSRTSRAGNTTFGDCVDSAGSVTFEFGPNDTKSAKVRAAGACAACCLLA